MKTNTLIVSEEALINILNGFAKDIEHNENEYLVSIVMKRKLEKDHKKNYSIAFETKSGYHDNRVNFTATTIEFKKILMESLEKNTPIDFALIEGTIQNHSDIAYAFQVKRFIPTNFKDLDNQLLEYINKVVSKYKPGDASLIVVPLIKTDELIPINIKYLRDNLIMPNDSFGGIFLLTASDNSGLPLIIKLWAKE